MGNEASRASGDGLTPRGYSPGSMSPGMLSSSPRTPSGNSNAVRRAKSFSSTGVESPSPSNPAIDKTIQRMDKTIRKRVRGGITYNMKIILRGDRGTGKTSLFHRLKGLPIPTTHEPTPQLQSATINWSFRANSEESVKCDVWDVVDKGFVVGGAEASSQNQTGDHNLSTANPFEAGGSQSTASGAHVVATVDATTVDVYQETHGVVFLLDVTKPHTLEYVRQQLDHVPVHIPTLVLGNFRDCGAQRKIFKEDIQELLYGGGSTSSRTMRRPQELLYFECSLLNCYGLKALHQYLGIPFLQLKQQTIRQQLRIVEGEFAHLKHDLQAKIGEQKYAEYLDHIKVTGSDIRTGRRVSGAAAAAAAGVRAASVSDDNVVVTTPAAGTTELKSGGKEEEEEEQQQSSTRLDRTLSSSSDIVVGSAVAAPSLSPTTSEMPELPMPSLAVTRQVDLEDLPDRATAQALQVGNELKIEYSEDEKKSALGTTTLVTAEKETVDAHLKKTSERGEITNNNAHSATKSVDKKAPAKGDESVMKNLEDFQVPKARFNELDDFYSDDNSDDDAEDDDEDVVVGPNGTRRLGRPASAKYSHKQLFLESDDSDSDAEIGTSGQRRPRRSKKTASSPESAAASQPQRSPRRQIIAKPVQNEPTASALDTGATTPPSPVRALPPSAPPAPRASPQHSPQRRRVKEPVIVACSTPESAPVVEVSRDVVTSATESVVSEVITGDQTAEDAATTLETETKIEAERADEVVAQIVDLAVETARVDDTKDQEVVEVAVDEDGDVVGEMSVSAVTETDVHADDVETPPTLASVGEDDGRETETTMDAPVHSAEVVEDEDELIVAVDGGEMDSFFSDEEEDTVATAVRADGTVDSEQVVEDNRSADGLDPVLSADETTKPIESTDTEICEEDTSDQNEPPSSTGVGRDSRRPDVLQSDSESDTEREGPRPSVVMQLKQQHKHVALDLSDDDDDGDSDETSEPPPPPVPATNKPQSGARRPRKVEILHSDDDDDDDDEDATPTPAPQRAAVASSTVERVRETSNESAFSSPPFAPTASTGSVKSSDLLEDFLNDSGSDSDAESSRPQPAAQKRHPGGRNDSEDDDEEDGALNDRFAAYDAKKSKQRISKAMRKQQREEIQKLTMATTTTTTTATSASTSTSRTSSFSNASESSSRTSSVVNQDVLAAIRQAEQDALRMLEASTPVRKAIPSLNDDAEIHGKKTKKTKKSSSSSRHKTSRGDGEEDGDEEKSKKNSTKKKKDRESSSSSSKTKSKRREMILTDEDE